MIDTVISNRVAGIPIDSNYNIYGNQLIIPDLTLFVGIDEKVRQYRTTNRGKSELDKVLDDSDIRNKFLIEFENLLVPESIIYVNNDEDLETTISSTYQKIKEFKEKNDYIECTRKHDT